MDLNTNLILDFYITQCTEAGNSVNMEKYGLKKCIENLLASDVSIDTLTTDRYVQIRSFLKKEYPEIKHQFDVWHIGKSVGKKISQKSKVKGCEKLKDWRKSIVNHLWYSCATCDGDEDILIECWISVLQHITNVHVFPGNHVTECRHGVLGEEIQRKTKWLKPNSAAHLALKEIVINPRLLKDIRQCSKFCHTGNLESYHSLMLKYCPKRLHYSMAVMNARTQLAALDHNFNVNRSQATIKKGQRKGEARYRTECPKMSKEWVAKKVYEEKSYEHVHKLMDRAVFSLQNNHLPERPVKRSLPKNISGTEKPNKEEIIRKRVSRFSS
ncbi:uncharacterized protein LOC123542510 [Mercenaria mercenaria]|uniref:uncharacterized protein LOC123542510 n=1 Tax=Mercenaria mercenaria TaxID=6596 RepID=UPI00234E8371|nr:uncharacterized protein LOC123542510 [Mercenaria mercenaria]